MTNIESLYSNSPTPSFLVDVILERKDGKGRYEIFANQTVGAGNEIISEIKISQNIFNPFISGFIELYDKGDWTGELNLTGFENIIFKFSLNEQDLIEVKCRIYEAKLVNDISRAPKLNNIHNIKQDIGINNFNSERSIGQRISLRLEKNCFFLRFGICINKTVKNSIYKL